MTRFTISLWCPVIWFATFAKFLSCSVSCACSHNGKIQNCFCGTLFHMEHWVFRFFCMFVKTIKMKKILLIVFLATTLNTAMGQALNPPISITLTKGAIGSDFYVNNMRFPLNSVIMNISATDTSKVELDLVSNTGAFGQNDILVTQRARVKYINGTTGLPFASIGKLRDFYDSFMVSAPIMTTVTGNTFTSIGDATAANQVIMIARLDSIAKYTSTQGVTITHIDSTLTFAVPTGSIIIGGLRDNTGALLTVANVANLSTTEKLFLTSFSYGVIPMQSFRSLATSHTITANVSCNVFVLKLN